jgi:type IV secretory pathway TraG/TraD family ATPase VirD4
MTQSTVNAKYATREDLLSKYPLRHVSKGGFRLGNLEVGQTTRTQHFGVVAGTGTGKTTAVMLANAIRDMHSDVSVCYSDKRHPEMYNLFSKIHDSLTKKNKNYTRVLACFSPYDPDNCIRLNFIDGVDTIDEAITWADIIFNNSSGKKITTSSEGAEFYKLIEKSLLEALMIFVNNEAYKRLNRNNFSAILKLLSLPQTGPYKRPDSSNQLQAKLICQDYTIKDPITKQLVSAWSIIKDNVDIFFQLETEKILGIILSLKNRLRVFRSPYVQFATSQTELPLSTLGKMPVTYILGLPTSEGEKANILAALFWEMLAKELRNVAKESPNLTCPNLVALYIDEAGNQGFFDLPALASEIRKYNVTIIAAFQTLAQLDRIWGKEGRELLLANLQNTIVLYGCGLDAAEYFSALAGTQIVKTVQTSTSKSKKLFSFIPTISESERDQERKEDLITPQMIMKMTDIDGEPGLKYELDENNEVLVDIEGRDVIRTIPAIAFLYKSNPAKVELTPYYKDSYIMSLINDGVIIKLRDKIKPFTQELFVETVSWNINEKLFQAPVVTTKPAHASGVKPVSTPAKPSNVAVKPVTPAVKLKPTGLFCRLCNDVTATLIEKAHSKSGKLAMYCTKDPMHIFSLDLKDRL